MKNLIEISKIVTKKKVRKIEIFDDHTLKTKNSKFNDFYEALQANKFKNDRDAATFLYDCSPTDDKYRQLKSRFRKRLLNTLFFLDVNLPSTSTYDRAYFSCNKEWALVKILISNDAHSTAEQLTKQILTTSLKYKFSDLIVNCSRILRRYAAINGKEKDFEKYDEYIKQYADVLDAEIRSEELYQRVIINYYLPPSKNKDLRERIDTYCEALVGISEIYESPVILYNMYLVWTYRFEMLQDFESMIEVCGRAESYIEQNPIYYQDDKLSTFQMKKMSAYLHLKDYKNGKVNAEKSLKSFSKGTETWFTFLEYYVLLAIHTDNYINAFAIYNQATTSSKFKKLDNKTREKWRVIGVYLSYIVESEGEQNPVFQAQKKKNLKSSRFLTESILYPKDQFIFTVLMLIGQTLFFLEKKSFDQAIERIDKLKGYTNRQLKKEEYYRVTQFIRLLQQLVKADFQVEQLSNTEKYYNRLIETPFFYRGMITEFEVIPYEKLWNMILSRLY